MDKIKRLNAYLARTKMQLEKETRPEMQAFLSREVKKTISKIEYLTLGGK